MIARVYLDLHGTLADFVGGWCRLTGRPMLARWPSHIWTLEEAFECSSAEVWDPIRRAGVEWWSTLDPMPEAASILALARSLADEVVFVTSPSSPLGDRHSEVAGSTRLIVDRYGSPPRIVTDKSELARPDRMLIDDSPVQVGRWQNAGGPALLVPRLWNGRALDPAATMTELRRQAGATDLVEAGVFRVDVPVPPEILRPNGRTTNYKARAAAVRKYRLACGVLARDSLRRQRVEPPRWSRVTIEPRFRTNGPKWDDGNAIGALKAAEDALQDAGVIENDRGVKWIAPTFARVPELNRTGVELIVRRVA